MPTEPFSWNVVVNGSWNTAILSPDGVRRRLLQLADNILMNVEVAIDKPGLFRIVHEDIVVVPGWERLEVGVLNLTADSLRRACALCRRALESLPETPVSAAGVNIRYRMTEIPDGLLDLLRTPLDATLSDANFQLGPRVTKRAIVMNPGVLNLQITTFMDAGGTVEFNFHRDSTVAQELSGWIDRSDEFLRVVEQISFVMGVTDVRREVNA